MKSILSLFKQKQEIVIEKQVIKTKSTVYPDKNLDINSWYKYIAMSNDKYKPQ